MAANLVIRHKSSNFATANEDAVFRCPHLWVRTVDGPIVQWIE